MWRLVDVRFILTSAPFDSHPYRDLVPDVRESSVEEPSQRRPGLGWFAPVKQHITGVTGALGVLVLLKEILTFDLRGIVADLVKVWQDYVGGFVGWALDWLVTRPLSVMGVHVHIPVLLRDYVAVGVIVSLSAYRAMSKWDDPGRSTATMLKGRALLVAALLMVGGWVCRILVWPFVLVIAAVGLIPGFARRALAAGPERFPARFKVVELPPKRYFTMIFTPLIYLAVLLAPNFLLQP